MVKKKGNDNKKTNFLIVSNFHSSLIATIRKQRPELLPTINSLSIPSDPPPKFFHGNSRISFFSFCLFSIIVFIVSLLSTNHFKTVYEVPGVGELMAPFFPTSSFNPDLWCVPKTHFLLYFAYSYLFFFYFIYFFLGFL